MATFFTADSHFGHGGALGLFRRPFPSVGAMDEAMILRWNEVVSPGDVVWHLGDFAVRQSSGRMADVLGALQGEIHLIAGNNDGPGTRSLQGFVSVRDYAEILLDGVALVLCHYPFRSWNGLAKGWVHLHGHSHGRLEPMTRRIDVGVDAWDFRPVTLDDLAARHRIRKRAAALDPGQPLADT